MRRPATSRPMSSCDAARGRGAGGARPARGRRGLRGRRRRRAATTSPRRRGRPRLVRGRRPGLRRVLRAVARRGGGRPGRADRDRARLRRARVARATRGDGRRARCWTLLRQQGVSDEAYRAYVRSELLLVEAYREYFDERGRRSRRPPQRRVAQIFIAAARARPCPQERARHVLIQPLPAARRTRRRRPTSSGPRRWPRPRRSHELRAADDADWFEHRRGAQRRHRLRRAGRRPRLVRPGDLAVRAGVHGGARGPRGRRAERAGPHRVRLPHHPEDRRARSARRRRPTDLVEQLRADPDTFAEVATRISEDAETARRRAASSAGWPTTSSTRRSRTRSSA